MIKKMKLFILFVLSFFITGSTLRYKPVDAKIEAISQEVEEEINKEINNIIEQHCKVENANISTFVDNISNEFINDSDNQVTNKQELSNSIIQNIYENTNDDVKVELEKLKENNPDMELIYKIFTGENYNLNNYNFADANYEIPKLNERVNRVVKNGIKKFAAAMAISSTTLIIMESCVKGASAASAVPFVGWALAAAIIVALIAIICVYWEEIKRSFDEIKTYFVEKYRRISSLISSTMAQAKTEKQKEVYFPFNPYDFNPRNLRREIYYGSYNGQIWKWFESGKMIFEWDEDYRMGRHYHILSHNGPHYWPNTRIPEPYASNYF